MPATQAQLDDLTPAGADTGTIHQLADAHAGSGVPWSDLLTLVRTLEGVGLKINWQALLKLFTDIVSGASAATIIQDIIAVLGG